MKTHSSRALAVLATGAMVFAVAACGDDDDIQPKADSGASSSGDVTQPPVDSGPDTGPGDDTFPKFVRSLIETKTSDTSAPASQADIEKPKEGANDNTDLTVFSGFF